MTTFLFWNLGRRPLQAAVTAIARQNEVDVIMLAECLLPPNTILKTLNPIGRSDYHYAPSQCGKIKIFTRFPAEFIRPLFENNRTTIRHLRIPATTDILLAVTHLPSKSHWKESSQVAEITVLADEIRDLETRMGHSRTVLVGDLNANPFEPGIVNASALHGVMCRRIAEERQRVVQGRPYPYFYNPMWSLLGDASPGVPGTYFYRSAEHTVYFWNMFDQVLIRPDLLNAFSNEDLEVLQSDGVASLLSQNGLPDADAFSDHLPVLFRLRL